MTLDEGTIADLEREFAVFVRQDRAASGRPRRDVRRELTDAAYRLLAHLAEQGPCRVTALACHAGVTLPTVSRQLHEVRAARTGRLAELLASWTASDVRTFATLLARFNDGATRPSRRCGGPE
ncbi:MULTISPECIES: MarR family transcriptional regulator [Amycolatopsis]|uniref:MarR family protein n=2 Tax=Amycolatopsis TaxID=1813 RepID=A0A1I4D5N7_9PSEU|nr:MarR family transcriptional regulator [Amycolatopsis sacchari]SFK87737.1 MarR family protein [Amycolatopsis sacchari]